MCYFFINKINMLILFIYCMFYKFCEVVIEGKNIVIIN